MRIAARLAVALLCGRGGGAQISWEQRGTPAQFLAEGAVSC